MSDGHNKETPTQRAVRLAGGQTSLANHLGISPQAVQQWVDNDRVSYRRVAAVEKLTGVPAHELRPDLYPPERHETVRQAIA